MNKFILAIIVVVSVLVVIGCENIDLSKVSDSDLERISEKLIVCPEKYIRFGSSCCLDKDENKICDGDERELTKDEKEEEKDIEPAKPVPANCEGNDCDVFEEEREAPGEPVPADCVAGGCDVFKEEREAPGEPVPADCVAGGCDVFEEEREVD